MNGRDRNALREFHQQLKINNTWLMPMEYETPLLASESLTNALMQLQYNVCEEFSKP